MLLTHVGPYDSMTTIIKQKDAYPIMSGSEALTAYLKKYQSKLMCAIHGHSHSCDASVKYSSSQFPVINPGGMTMGKYLFILQE